MAGMKQQRRLQSAFLFSEAGLASACLIAPHNAAEHPALQRECRGLCLGSSVTLERERERVCVCVLGFLERPHIALGNPPWVCALVFLPCVCVDVLLCPTRVPRALSLGRTLSTYMSCRRPIYMHMTCYRRPICST